MTVEKFTKEVGKVTSQLAEDLKKMRGNRVAPEVVTEVEVDAYESKSPIQNLANVSNTDARTIVVQPWDKSIIENIEKALIKADLGAQVQVDTGLIRVIFPDMTKERREEMVKVMKQRAEQAKVQVREVRKETMKDIEEAQEGGLSEDEAFRRREEVEKLVKSTNQKIDDMRDTKEEQLMTV
ncbi:ribosome recycling factor [Candidatus Dojkabacteria bacterium]|nr:ribosome recycling factor [Candidatus Dojkabacteria bacterium]